jgi:hypothetical protein
MTRRQADSQLGEADDPTGSDTNSRRIVNVQCVSLCVKNPEAGMRKARNAVFLMNLVSRVGKDGSIDIWFGPKQPDDVADPAFIQTVPPFSRCPASVRHGRRVLRPDLEARRRREREVGGLLQSL